MDLATGLFDLVTEDYIYLNLRMHRFYTEQNLPVSKDQVWKFFSDASNLMILTHPKMKMTMESENGLTPIFEGKILKIKIKLFGIFPSFFLSEITELQAPDFFIDTQLKGPFAYWQHKHLLTEIDGGTKITDEVTFKFPLGFMGVAAYHLFGKEYLKGVFDYRKIVLEKRFGVFE